MTRSTTRRMLTAVTVAGALLAGPLLGGSGAGAAQAGAVAAGAVAAGAATANGPAPTSLAQQGWLDDQESTVHYYTRDEAVAQAKRFSLISALPGTYDAYVGAMKAANPDLRIVAYMNGTMALPDEIRHAPESWFLHDAAGHRLVNSWHLSLMDPTNPAWIADRVQTCEELIRQTGYDGCFLDNLGVGTLFGGAIDPATGRMYDGNTWLKRSTHIADVLREHTGKLILGNGLVNGAAYFSDGTPSSVIFDGAPIGCAETFLRDPTQPVGVYRSVPAWQQDVDMLVNAAAHHHSVATIVKMWAPATQAQVDSWHRFALGSFLLGADTGQYFEFSSSRATLSDGDAFLPKIAPLGLPTGNYTVVGGIYERPFTGGRVVVNPGDTALTIPLDGAYTGALSGWHVSGSLTVAPHQAWFLLH